MQRMDWNTLASALLGGILGGGLGSWVAYMSLRDTRAQARRDRQWLDAETVSLFHPDLGVAPQMA